MIVNPQHHHHRYHLTLRQPQDSITILQEEEEEEEVELPMKKAPNSFLLYKTKRRHDSNGKYISSQQLVEEWERMSEEQKVEFQNQSQCIQFTLDIDYRNNTKKLPKIIVPPPSSMVIPNDHSVDSSPRDEGLHYQHHHYHHHSLSDLLSTSPPTTYLPKPSSSFIHTHHHHQQKQHNKNKSNTNNYIMPYSAAAEAAALGSLSFTTTTTQTPPPPAPIVKSSNSIKKKYGILPEKVRRPPNAYLLFNRDMRRQLHDINQGLTSGEISKSISKRWKELLPLEKEYYIKEEAKLKQQHNNEHSNFIYTRRSKAEMKQAGMKQQQQKSVMNVKAAVTVKPPTTPTAKRKSSSTLEGRDPRGRKKKKADDTLPKHPMSGYLHFAKEMRPIMKKKYPDARLVEISKHIGVQWRSMSEIELQPWIDIANRDKERYAREMKDRLLSQAAAAQQQQTLVEDDVQSFSSSSSIHTTSSSLQQHYTKDTTLIEELDSHTIATVAQMVNPTSSF